MSSSSRQYLAGISASIGALASGAALTWIGLLPSIFKIGYLTELISIKEDLSVLLRYALLGAMLSCLLIGKICDFIGRKLAMLLLIIPFIIGWFMMVFSNSEEMLTAGVVITGFGAGGFCVTIPIYNAEISTVKTRRFIGCFYQLSFMLGVFLAAIFKDSTDFIPFTVICMCLPVIFGIAHVFQPESPVYLVKKDKIEQAKNALIKLRGSSYDVDGEISEIKELIEDGDFESFFESSKSNLRALFSCIMLIILHQYGIGNMFHIFYDLKRENDETFLIILISSCIIIGAFLSMILINKFGVRILLYVSTSGSFLVLCIIVIQGIVKEIEEDPENGRLTGTLPLVVLCLFAAINSIGFSTIPWLLTSELLNVKIKSVYRSLFAILNWALLLAWTYENSYVINTTTNNFYILSMSVIVYSLATCTIIYTRQTTRSIWQHR